MRRKRGGLIVRTTAHFASLDVAGWTHEPGWLTGCYRSTIDQRLGRPESSRHIVANFIPNSSCRGSYQESGLCVSFGLCFGLLDASPDIPEYGRARFAHFSRVSPPFTDTDTDMHIYEYRINECTDPSCQQPQHTQIQNTPR